MAAQILELAAELRQPVPNMLATLQKVEVNLQMFENVGALSVADSFSNSHQ